MSFIYITGMSGTGKSDVCKELKSRGFEAYDVDIDELSKWYNRKTGLLVSKSVVFAAPADEWFSLYEFKISRTSVEKLIPKDKTKLVFFCAV